MPPTISTRLRAWRAAQPCPHCAGTGKTHRQMDDVYQGQCWICKGTGTGLSQAKSAKLAEVLTGIPNGIPVATWRNWEAGRRQPEAAALALLERMMAGATVVPVVNPQGESEQP